MPSAGKVIASELTAEKPAAFDNPAKHPVEIRDTKIVYVFIEHVEPRAVLADPVETGDFDIDQTGALVGVAQRHKEFVGVWYVLQHG